MVCEWKSMLEAMCQNSPYEHAQPSLPTLRTQSPRFRIENITTHTATQLPSCYLQHTINMAFLSHPAELRNQVYEYALSLEETSFSYCAGLHMSCRQVRPRRCTFAPRSTHTQAPSNTSVQVKTLTSFKDCRHLCLSLSTRYHDVERQLRSDAQSYSFRSLL